MKNKGKPWDSGGSWTAWCWTVAGITAGLTIVAPQAHAAVTPEAPQVGQAMVVVKKVEGTIEKQRRLLVRKDDVFQNEVVETGAGSASEIRFVDNTRITVGPNSKIVLDQFVFDPEPGRGKFVLRVTEGVFRFFSGDMDSTAYNIQTPTLSIGVRGTTLVVVTRANGEVAVILESDDGVTIDSETGETVVLNAPGLATIAFIGGGLSDPGPPPAWALWRVREMDALLASLGLPPPPGDDDIPGPPPPAEPLGPPDPPPPPVVESGRLRALPRAEQNVDGGGLLSTGRDLPFDTANDPHATGPGSVPVGGGGVGGTSGASTSSSGGGGGGTTSSSSNGRSRGNGNGAANGAGHGASNGAGNGNAR